MQQSPIHNQTFDTLRGALSHMCWTKPVWPAKLLVFGEYSMYTTGGMALGIPMDAFALTVTDAAYPNPSSIVTRLWQEFCAWRGKPRGLSPSCDVRSSIPMQVGLGSSAALCAGVVAWAHAQGDVGCMDIDAWWEVVTALESVIHGKSSGIDPLIVAAQCPLLFTRLEMGKLDLQAASVPTNIGVWVIPGERRKQESHTWIAEIRARLRQMQWETSYQACTREAILAYLAGDVSRLSSVFQELSYMQERLGLLDSKDVTQWMARRGVIGVKVLGAGGGGCLAVVAEKGVFVPLPSDAVIWSV